jgi:hypothetical protein
LLESECKGNTFFCNRQIFLALKFLFQKFSC